MAASEQTIIVDDMQFAADHAQVEQSDKRDGSPNSQVNRPENEQDGDFVVTDWMTSKDVANHLNQIHDEITDEDRLRYNDIIVEATINSDLKEEQLLLAKELLRKYESQQVKDARKVLEHG